MYDKKLTSEIESIEKEFISARKEFTSLDVGNAAKAKGINARQRWVSEIVRDHFANFDLYANAGYTRTLIDVNSEGKSAKANLYFHMMDNSDDYTAIDQKVLPWDPNREVFNNNVSTVSQDGLSSIVNSTSTANTSVTQNCVQQLGTPLYVASRRSRILHSPDCGYAKQITAKNIKRFIDQSEVSGLYRICKRE